MCIGFLRFFSVDQFTTDEMEFAGSTVVGVKDAVVGVVSHTIYYLIMVIVSKIYRAHVPLCFSLVAFRLAPRCFE